jgi:GNAT superfamily N-acetyltransferase
VGAEGEGAGTERPAIQMLRPHLEGLPPLAPALAALPPRLRLRTYREGDEPSWAGLMNTGQMGEWTAQRTREQLTGRPSPQFDPQGFFVLATLPSLEGEGESRGGAETRAGAACAWLRDPQERETGVLHMVCVLPAHRGRGLSYPLCLAVLHRFRERAYRRVALNTHEWRMGAVKVYLRLGFQPLYRHPRHPEQWAGVLRTLGWKEPVQAMEEPGAWPAVAAGASAG